MSRWRNGLALGAALLMTAGLGCNSNPELFEIPPPDFRGITIPLPPPSLADAPKQSVDLEGTIGHDPGPGTMVYFWSDDEVEGAIVGADGNGDFEFVDHDVTVGSTCLELYYEFDDGEGLRQSEHAYYKVILGSGETCTDGVMPCSQVDEEDNCACLDYFASGC